MWNAECWRHCVQDPGHQGGTGRVSVGAAPRTRVIVPCVIMAAKMSRSLKKQIMLVPRRKRFDFLKMKNKEKGNSFMNRVSSCLSLNEKKKRFPFCFSFFFSLFLCAPVVVVVSWDASANGNKLISDLGHRSVPASRHCAGRNA